MTTNFTRQNDQTKPSDRKRSTTLEVKMDLVLSKLDKILNNLDAINFTEYTYTEEEIQIMTTQNDFCSSTDRDEEAYNKFLTKLNDGYSPQ